MVITPEKAREVLLVHEGTQHEANLDYFRAVADGILPQYYTDRCFILSLYSDDLPQEKVGPQHPDFPCMKCRGNFIIGLCHTLSDIVDHGLVDTGELVDEINRLVNYPWRYGSRDPATWVRPDEIRLINQTVSGVIDYMVTKYHLVLDTDKLKKDFSDMKESARRDWSISGVD